MRRGAAMGYEAPPMLRRRAIVVALALFLTPVVARGAPSSAALPDIRTLPFAFTPTNVPNSDFSEPTMAMTKKDSALFCGPRSLSTGTVAYIRSPDWSMFNRQDLAGGGGDCDVKVGPDNAVYVAQLQASGSLIRKSVDDGATFPTASTTEDPIEQDRQWLGPDPVDPKTVYFAYHDLAAEAEVVAKSTDGGQTFPVHSVVSNDASQASDTFPNTFSGPIRVDPSDHNRVYVVYGISTRNDNVATCTRLQTDCPFGAPRSVIVA